MKGVESELHMNRFYIFSNYHSECSAEFLVLPSSGMLVTSVLSPTTQEGLFKHYSQNLKLNPLLLFLKSFASLIPLGYI